MRDEIVAALRAGRMMPAPLTNGALVRFQRMVERSGAGARAALVFGERDRIVRELRDFLAGPLSVRLSALHARDVLAGGRAAAPFDIIVRDRRGYAYGVVFRRLPDGGARLEALRRIRNALVRYTRAPLRGALVYDFHSGRARLVRHGGLFRRAA